MAAQPIPGIHHVTAIASDPQQNLDFYTRVLGLRLVKLTVNFDDPGTYHFYFGDERGTPGSILTFFPWPHARRGAAGVGEVGATAFAIRAASVSYWTDRLRTHGASPADDERFGAHVIRFQDPDGLQLELIAADEDPPSAVWTAGPVPAPHALRGFHSATLSESDRGDTAELLTMMGFQLETSEGQRFRYRAAGPGAAVIDVLQQPNAEYAELGAGSVHHIAFRTPTDEQQGVWRHELVGRGYRVTPIIDRMYFHSIYFREPGGVLFEVATAPPGFAVDERPEHLGERLTLPQWLEPQRADLELRLPRLTRYAHPTAD